MKKLLLLCCGLLTFGFLQAQSSCTGDTAGVLSSNIVPYTVGLNDTTPLPTFSVAPVGLPNIEFVVSLKDSVADDGFGAAIIGASIDGRVRPSGLGMSNCDEFFITPVAYDLHQLRVLVQTLLNGNANPAVTCCQFVALQFPGFCDTLQNNGIVDSNSITSLSDFFVVVQSLSGGGSISVQGAVASLDFLNSALGFLGSCNGGVTTICYSVDTLGYDYYQVAGAALQSFRITPDTGLIANGSGQGSFQFGLSPNPSGACVNDVEWTVIGLPSTVSIDQNGLATANSFDTVQIEAYSMLNPSIRDTATLIVRAPLVGVQQTNADFAALIAPNPTTAQSNLLIQTPRADSYSIRIVDMAGQVVFQQHQELSVGQTVWVLPTEQLAAGVYVLQIQNSQSVLAQALIKQ